MLFTQVINDKLFWFICVRCTSLHYIHIYSIFYRQLRHNIEMGPTFCTFLSAGYRSLLISIVEVNWIPSFINQCIYLILRELG